MTEYEYSQERRSDFHADALSIPGGLRNDPAVRAHDKRTTWLRHLSMEGEVVAYGTHEAEQIVLHQGLVWKFLRPFGPQRGASVAAGERHVRVRAAISQVRPEFNPMHYDQELRCIVSPYVEGRRPARAEIREVLNDLRRNGLGYVGDITSQNVVVAPDGRAIVIDCQIELSHPEFVAENREAANAALFHHVEPGDSSSVAEAPPCAALETEPDTLVALAFDAADLNAARERGLALRKAGEKRPILIWCRSPISRPEINRHCWTNGLRFIDADAVAYRFGLNVIDRLGLARLAMRCSPSSKTLLLGSGFTPGQLDCKRAANLASCQAEQLTLAFDEALGRVLVGESPWLSVYRRPCRAS